MKLQNIEQYIIEAKKPNIPDAIKSLIDSMIEDKVYKRIVKIPNEAKHKLFMKDVQSAIDAKLLTVKHTGEDDNEMEIKVSQSVHDKMFEEDDSITEGTFQRLPSKVIKNELYSIKDTLTSFYDRMESGNDYNPDVIKSLIERLKVVQKSAKKFKSKEEVDANPLFEAASTKEPIDEALVLPRQGVFDLLPASYLSGGVNQDKDSTVITDLVNTINNFYKKHKINMSIKT